MTARRASMGAVARVRERAPRYTLSIGPVVVDASVAFLWFANEPDRVGATRLLQADAALLAPDLMAVEAANAWWKKLRRREMETADVEQAEVGFAVQLRPHRCCLGGDDPTCKAPEARGITTGIKVDALDQAGVNHGWTEPDVEEIWNANSVEEVADISRRSAAHVEVR